MVIMAHPDDAEFTSAGTVALWASGGCQIAYVVCTDGNAGSHEPGMTQEKLAAIRQAEQRAACRVLGVESVVFLGYPDGQLEPSLPLRRDLVQVIRQHKPEVVITGDPTMLFHSDEYINHPDHRAASLAALDAVAPAAAMPLLWPETGAPHRVRRVLVQGSAEANLWIDITTTIERKIEALRQHASQLTGWDPAEMIRAWAEETGKEKGLAYAERFRAFLLEKPEADG